jgi:hypothetical protein
MAPNVIQTLVMAPNVAANTATVRVVENASIQDGGRGFCSGMMSKSPVAIHS